MLEISKVNHFMYGQIVISKYHYLLADDILYKNLHPQSN